MANEFTQFEMGYKLPCHTKAGTGTLVIECSVDRSKSDFGVPRRFFLIFSFRPDAEIGVEHRIGYLTGLAFDKTLVDPASGKKCWILELADFLDYFHDEKGNPGSELSEEGAALMDVDHLWYIDEFCIEPDWRGKGLGKAAPESAHQLAASLPHGSGFAESILLCPETLVDEAYPWSAVQEARDGLDEFYYNRGYRPIARDLSLRDTGSGHAADYVARSVRQGT